MSLDEIERAVAESGVVRSPRTRLARGSGELVAPPELAGELDPGLDPYPDPALRLLPFRARRPVLATFLTTAAAVALLLALYAIIAGA